MKSLKLLLIVTAMSLAALAIGCSQKPTASSASDAIEQSKTQASVQDQVDYLAGQARSFINSKNFDQAVTVANYILNNLDKNSQVAKDILEQAKAEMQKVAQTAMDDMKKKMGTLGQ